VALLRRRKSDEQLLRDAGLDRIELPLQPPLLERLGVPTGRSIGAADWDASVTVRAPGLLGDKIVFTTLPGGDVLVDEEGGDADVSALANAVERELAPPYRARAGRQGADLWGVLAQRIEVERIAWSHGDALELSRKDSWQELRIDGEPTTARIPALERLGERAGPDFFVKAERLDGDLWEVRVSAL
jgi:hypothetical protein